VTNVGQERDWHLRTSRGWHEHALERVEVLAKVARVARVNRIAFTAFHRGGDVLAADGALNDIVHITDLQSVARGGFAINSEIKKVTANGALGEGAACIRLVAQLALDLHGELLDLAKIRPKNFYPEHAAKPSGKHLGAGLDRHPEDVRHAGCLDVGVYFREELVPGHSFAPFIRRLEGDNRFEHR